jgi:hypothetical protein
MLRVIEDMARDWRRRDERIDGLSSELPWALHTRMHETR